jgi:protein-arginine kinase activator protein McsA
MLQSWMARYKPVNEDYKPATTGPHRADDEGHITERLSVCPDCHEEFTKSYGDADLSFLGVHGWLPARTAPNPVAAKVANRFASDPVIQSLFQREKETCPNCEANNFKSILPNGDIYCTHCKAVVGFVNKAVLH